VTPAAVSRCGEGLRKTAWFNVRPTALSAHGACACPAIPLIAARRGSFRGRQVLQPGWSPTRHHYRSISVCIRGRHNQAPVWDRFYLNAGRRGRPRSQTSRRYGERSQVGGRLTCRAGRRQSISPNQYGCRMLDTKHERYMTRHRIGDLAKTAARLAMTLATAYVSSYERFQQIRPRWLCCQERGRTGAYYR
jgi:hypothetical protein